MRDVRLGPCAGRDRDFVFSDFIGLDSDSLKREVSNLHLMSDALPCHFNRHKRRLMPAAELIKEPCPFVMWNFLRWHSHAPSSYLCPAFSATSPLQSHLQTNQLITQKEQPTCPIQTFDLQMRAGPVWVELRENCGLLREYRSGSRRLLRGSRRCGVHDHLRTDRCHDAELFGGKHWDPNAAVAGRLNRHCGIAVNRDAAQYVIWIIQ